MQTWVVFSAIQTQLSTRLDTNEKLTSVFQCFFFRRANYAFSVGLMQYSQDSQIFYSATFSLKIDPTALFTYLKIILLQYF